MIYFTTFIFTLLLAHIVHAVPACGDVASPEDKYDLTYDNEQVVLHATSKVTYSNEYDEALTKNKCPKFPKYEYYENFPDYPYLGAAYDIKSDFTNCGQCWKLTTTSGTGKYIFFLAIDKLSGTVPADTKFTISEHAYADLHNGWVNASMDAAAELADIKDCKIILPV
ncbi:hypothetical protein BGY98DRAFT_376531 [Russula aff. rugulosa BPL654]|nr:hypothetical protein BGY98DRAFT_376531 [Russula aff. rugulosa BPL654]